MKKPTTVEEYIASYPENTQIILEQVRATIKKAAPEAEEVISYSMPAFKLKGMLVWYGAHPRHIGFYPGRQVLKRLRKSYGVIKARKARCSSPLISRCRWH